MSNIKRYIPVSIARDGLYTVHESVMAVKVTEKNLVSTLNWAEKWAQAEAKIDIDSKGDESGHRIKIRTPQGWRVAKVGEYVVRHFAYVGKVIEKGDSPYYFSVGKDEFLENFELV